MCHALYLQYDEGAKGDLVFHAGDMIRLLAKVDAQWYKGELNGSTGIFPATFVMVIEDVGPVPPIKANPPSPKMRQPPPSASSSSTTVTVVAAGGGSGIAIAKFDYEGASSYPPLPLVLPPAPLPPCYW